MDKAVMGNMTIEVSNNGQDFSADGIEYAPSLQISASTIRMSPSSGPTNGGTLVTFSGKQWEPTGSVECAFSGGLVVEGVRGGEMEILCSTPRQKLEGVVSVILMLDGEDASQGSELAFEYEAPMVVSGIVPSAGAVEGSTLVQVLGSGFKAGSGLGCMFALANVGGDGSERVMTVTEGRWETSSKMVCESPRAGSEQTVSVEVSNNGADLTSSGVQFVYERAPTVTGVCSRGS